MDTLNELLQRSLGDRYTLERELGRGGWATVYLARDVKHDRQVAIKVFRPELAVSLGTGRFLQEIRLVAQFQHPHILPLHDSGQTLDSLYYVMPYIQGESLRERLRREGRLPVESALEIARDVAGALDYAHGRGVIHRDIKPENILLSGGHAIVADFGIARALRAARDDRLSRPGIAVGTPAYMSPEQALGGGESDPRSDIYSLGVVLYEMLAGAPPFADISVEGLVERDRQGIPPLDGVRPDVPARVSDAVMMALSMAPSGRFASAREFADAITPVGGGAGATWPPTRMVVKRRRTRGVFAVAAVMLGVGGWLAWRALSPPNAPSSPQSVVVLPFSVRGGDEARYLRNGMVDLLTTDLDGAGGLRAVDARAALGSLAPGDTTLLTVPKGESIARRLGAGLYVLGGVVEAGGQLRIEAALYDERRGTTPVARASANGPATRIFDLVDEIASELLAGQRGGPGGRLVRLAAHTTRSLPALKSYLQGEQQLRAGFPDSAMDAFARAIADDSLFALAYYRRAVAADWAARFEIAREAAKQAVRLGTRLAPDDAKLLRAFESWQRGAANEAEREYRGILAADPENVEAWYQLGEVLYHYDGVRGRPMLESRAAFERAHFYDSQHSETLYHLLDLVARAGDFAELDALLAGADPESEILLRRRAVRAFAIGTPKEQEAMLAQIRRGTDGTVIVTSGNVAAYIERFDVADRISRFLIEPTRSPAAQSYGHMSLAQLALGRGQLGSARAHLARTEALAPDLGLVYRALLAAEPFVPASPRDMEAARLAILRWDAASVADQTGSTVYTVHNGVQPVLRLYLLGLLSARLGDAAGAARYADELRRAPVPKGSGTLVPDLTEGVRAAAALARGDSAAALAALERVRSEVPLDRIANSAFYANALGRYQRAELLRRTGRARESLAWYATLGDGRYDVAYIAPAHLGQALAWQELADTAKAVGHYRRFLALWGDADAPLWGVVTDARARLAVLQARAGKAAP